MQINNKRQALKIRQLFFFGSIILISLIAVCFLFNYFRYGLISLVVASLYIIYFLTADYHYIIFESTDKMITLRYNKAISLGNSSPSTVSFPIELYHSSSFENSFWGRLTDLTLSINTQRGIADYPTVSLTAMKLSDREKIQAELNRIVI